MHKVTSRGALQPEKPSVEPETKNGAFNVTMNHSDYDFRKNSNAPTRCRFGSASIHLRTREVVQFSFIFFVVLTLVLVIYWIKQSPSQSDRLTTLHLEAKYDSTYPLTRPIKVKNGYKYRLGLITDLDHASKVEDTLWRSFLLKGYFYIYNNMTFHIEMDPSSSTLHSSLAQGQ